MARISTATFRVRRCPCVAHIMALGLVSPQCGGSDGSYDASVADIRDDVKLTLSVAADGSGTLSLKRWYGSKAYGWEHCPRLHAASTVNRRPLQLVEAGGWIPPSGQGFWAGVAAFVETCVTASGRTLSWG